MIYVDILPFPDVLILLQSSPVELEVDAVPNQGAQYSDQ